MCSSGEGSDLACFQSVRAWPSGRSTHLMDSCFRTCCKPAYGARWYVPRFGSHISMCSGPLGNILQMKALCKAKGLQFPPVVAEAYESCDPRTVSQPL